MTMADNTQIKQAIVSIVTKQGRVDRIDVASKICKQFNVSIDVPYLAIQQLCEVGVLTTGHNFGIFSGNYLELNQ